MIRDLRALGALRAGWADRIDAARAVVAAALEPTPLVRVGLEGFEAPTLLKLETLQPTGSFKVRGALNAVASCARDGTRVVTASAGNHGLGIAFAASRLGASATVVVPTNASAAKVSALRTFAVDLRLAGTSYDEAEAMAMGLAEEGGARFVSAYSDADVVAGQATVVREVAADLAGPFRVVVPVGGGGLACGTALGAPERAEVLGVEAAASPAVSAAVGAGRVVPVDVRPTLADGLAGNLAAGAFTPALLAELGTPLVTVGEGAIRDAIRALALRHGLVVEGSAAVGVAAALSGVVPDDLPTVFVLTGRNIEGALLAEILSAR